MTQQQWLERLSRRLTLQGLPARYVRRCVLELNDHLEDSDQTGDAFDLAVIGDPDALSISLVQTYRKATWLRRLPWCVWCFAAMPLAVITTLGYYICIGVIFGELERWFPSIGVHPAAQPITMWCFFVGKFAPPAIATYLLLQVLTRIGRPRWIGCLVASALTASFLLVVSELKFLGASDVDLSISLTSDGFQSTWQTAIQLCQASAVPLIVTWQMWVRGDADASCESVTEQIQ